MKSKALLILPLAMFVVTACSKKKEEAPPPAAPPAATAPAPGASGTSRAAASNPATEESPPLDAKAQAVKDALAEEAIASDAHGQWATAATASSTYAGDKTPGAKAAYAPSSATGAPDVERYGDNGNSWASETADKGIEWLELTFAKPVQATQIKIRQSYCPGAIIRIELIDEGGARHEVWQGIDDTKYPASKPVWLDKTFEKTAYKATGARLTLATNAVQGWNEIDAVQLLGD
jgi:hypothetical protein